MYWTFKTCRRDWADPYTGKLFGNVQQICGLVWQEGRMLCASTCRTHVQTCGIVIRPIAYTHHNFSITPVNLGIVSVKWVYALHMTAYQAPAPILNNKSCYHGQVVFHPYLREDGRIQNTSLHWEYLIVWWKSISIELCQTGIRPIKIMK